MAAKTNHTRRRKSSPLFIALLLLSSTFAESLLLSDLPTPCFVIDTQALQRIAIAPTAPSESLIPSIRLPESGSLFLPHSINLQADSGNICASTVLDVTFPVEEGQPSIGFLHSSVTRAREDATIEDDPISTFLAEIDLDPTLCGDDNSPAKLVLGLNNHHVGSYYWARSAGAGASMEAPGVSFGCSMGKTSTESKNGVLRWLDEGGPICCNSNDGKRSEWVNFLRRGDTVQLVPTNGQEAMLRMSERYRTAERGRIFGITAEGRPMGSEPQVVCEWRLSS